MVHKVKTTDKQNNIHVKLMADGVTGVRFIRVEVTSAIIVAVGRAKSQVDIYPSEVSSEADFRKKIVAAAGAMAERQCEKYGDNHDPAEVARMAGEAWDELKAEMGTKTEKSAVAIH